MTALTREDFDRLDYGAALALSNQLLPVQQPDRDGGANDNNIMITIGVLVGVILLLTLLSVIGIVSFVLCRQFK